MFYGLDLLRYHEDGSLDESFAETRLFNGFNLTSLSLLADGRMLLGGTRIGHFGIPNGAMARVKKDGGFEPGFGEGGVAAVKFSGSELGPDTSVDCIQQPGGRILMSQGSWHSVVGFVGDQNLGTARTMFDQATAEANLLGPDSEPDSMPFDDGIPNVLKYVIGLPLDQAADRAAPEFYHIEADPQGLGVLEVPLIQFAFRRRKESGLIYTLEGSETLESESWKPILEPITTVVDPIDQLWDHVTISARVPIDPERDNLPVKSYYGRLRVEFHDGGE